MKGKVTFSEGRKVTFWVRDPGGSRFWEREGHVSEKEDHVSEGKVTFSEGGKVIWVRDLGGSRFREREGHVSEKGRVTFWNQVWGDGRSRSREGRSQSERGKVTEGEREALERGTVIFLERGAGRGKVTFWRWRVTKGHSLEGGRVTCWKQEGHFFGERKKVGLGRGN